MDNRRQGVMLAGNTGQSLMAGGREQCEGVILTTERRREGI